MNRRLYEVRKSLKMTQKLMADILGIGQNAYSMIENGKIGLTTGNRIILESKLGINPDFLLHGTPPMTLKARSTAPQRPPLEAHTNTSEIAVGVPFFSKTINFSSTQTLLLPHSDVEYYVNYEPFNDCTFYRPVFGHSMSPRFNPADTIACKVVNSKNNIMYGQSYLCLISYEGDMYETFRILRKSEHEGYIILTPLNPSFNSTEIPLDAIIELYLVCGKIERTI